MNGESEFTGADKIMRIRMDFNNINASYAEVKEVKEDDASKSDKA